MRCVRTPHDQNGQRAYGLEQRACHWIPMKRIVFEVLPDRDGGWSVTRDHVVVAEFDTKAPAVAYAAQRGRSSWKAGRQAQLRIKGRDGRIQDERTYGEDPPRTPG